MGYRNSKNLRIAPLTGTFRVLLFLLLLGSNEAGTGGKPPATPAKISVSVEPTPVQAGGEARVTVSVEPVAGIKINRYPQVRLQVARRAGLTDETETAVGDSAPGSDDGSTGARYFDKVEPLRLVLAVDPAATSGPHEIEGKLLFYYCVPDEFCAPHRMTVKIPLAVR